MAKDSEVKKVLVELGGDDGQVQKLCERVRQVISQIRSCLPSIDLTEVKEQLKSISQEPTGGDADWNKIRGKLQRLVAMMYSLHDLKQKGLDAVPEKHSVGTDTVLLRKDVEAVLADLASHGVFLVPVGELESWLPVLMKGSSREDKSKWAMLAAEKIEEVGETDGDVWGFVHDVAAYLESRV